MQQLRNERLSLTNDQRCQLAATVKKLGRRALSEIADFANWLLEVECITRHLIDGQEDYWKAGRTQTDCNHRGDVRSYAVREADRVIRPRPLNPALIRFPSGENVAASTF